jgi:hypothetical protein
MIRSRSLLASSLVVALGLLTACDDVEKDRGEAAVPPNPFQEAVDLGAARFLGKAKPSEVLPLDNGVVAYTFDTKDGPSCLHGDPFTVSVRDQASEDLVIFLQGGGACWSDFCLAVTSAPAGIPKLDVLDPHRPTNPLRAMSHVYLPYCDGSLFAGSTEHDDDGDGQPDRIQHGLNNLSAALDLAASKFPNPRRVILAGSSGGAYGTILATILTRTRYRSAEILVFEDSGVGLGRPNKPEFVGKLIDEFGVRSWLPPSCKGCLDEGHISPLVAWELERDKNLSISAFSAYEDFVLSDIFLQIPGPDYHAALVSETDKISAKYGDRYHRFFINGAVHTTLLGGINGIVGDDISAVTLTPGVASKLADIQLGGIDKTSLHGVTIATWFTAMLNHDPAWVDLME